MEVYFEAAFEGRGTTISKIHYNLKLCLRQGVIAHTFYPSTQEADTGVQASEPQLFPWVLHSGKREATLERCLLTSSHMPRHVYKVRSQESSLKHHVLNMM